MNNEQETKDKIEKHYTSEVHDPTTTKGQDRIKAAAYEISRTKTTLDKMGKDLADELNAKLTPINGERKKSIEFLDKLKVKVREPVTKMEEAEKKRKLDIEKRITDFHYPDDAPKTREAVEAHMEKLNNLSIGADFQEYEESALGHRESEITRCKGLIYGIDEQAKIDAKFQAEQQESIRVLVAAEEKHKADAEVKRIENELKAEAERTAKLAEEASAKELTAHKAKLDAEAKERQTMAEAEKITIDFQVPTLDSSGRTLVMEKTLKDVISDVMLDTCFDMDDEIFERLLQDIESVVTKYFINHKEKV